MGLRQNEQRSVGLALGGGAARGIAHIGVLKALEEAGVTVSAVAGTSVGSIIGALYAGGMGWRDIHEFSKDIAWHKLLQLSFSGLGLAKTKRLEELVDELLGDRNIEDLQIPFAAVAADIGNMKEVVFRRGSVARAVRASSSVPGIFEPVVENGRALVDGGVINNLPTDLVRELGADTVIAVDLNRQIGDKGVPSNLFDVSYRSFAALIWNTSQAGREGADLLIDPIIGHINYHELGRAEELFSAGESAAKAALASFHPSTALS